VNELISNALKHAFPDGRRGTITIEFKQQGGKDAILSVEDDGVGVPESFSFEDSGTLGMQLVYMLAGQLRGEVAVERKPLTRFVVRFPLTH